MTEANLPMTLCPDGACPQAARCKRFVPPEEVFRPQPNNAFRMFYAARVRHGATCEMYLEKDDEEAKTQAV